MNNDNQVLYCYGGISHVDNKMPWGTSREYFKPGLHLDRRLIVNSWWAKVNNYEFIKELNYILSLSDEEYKYIYNYKAGTSLEIMMVLENFAVWLQANPSPVQLLFVGKGKHHHRTEILALSKSILIQESGQEIPLGLLSNYKLEDYNELSYFCFDWNITIEHLKLYTIII